MSDETHTQSVAEAVASQPEAATTPAPAAAPTGTATTETEAAEAAARAERADRVKATQLAALARRERAAAEAEKRSRAAAAEADQRSKAAEERAARIEADAKRIADLEGRIQNARRDPLGALKALGLSYKDITESVLADGKPSPDLIAADLDARLERELAARLKPLTERLEAFERQREAEEAARTDRNYQEAVTVLDRNAREFVTAHATDYPAIEAFDQHGEVARLIELEFERTGQIIHYSEAAHRIEAFLRDQFGIGGEDDRAARRRAYIQSQLAPPPPPVVAPPAVTRPRQGTKTITNAAASAATPTPPPAADRDSALERAKLILQQAKAKRA
jgi:hypothetical protein